MKDKLDLIIRAFGMLESFMDDFGGDPEDFELKDSALAVARELRDMKPCALVSDVYQSRYTIEWTNGCLPEGTKLYALDEVKK